MTDTIEFRVIDPFAAGELWASEEGRGVHRAVAVLLNGKDLCDHLREFEGEAAPAYGHNTPAALYEQLWGGALPGSLSWYDGAEVLCCMACGMSLCYCASVFVEVREQTVHWRVKSPQVQSGFLFFAFEKTAYLRAMQELYHLAGEPQSTPDRLSFLFNAVLRFYSPWTRDEYRGLCALAKSLGIDPNEPPFPGYAHAQSGLLAYLRQAGFSETEIQSSGISELSGEALLLPLSAAMYPMEGVTVLSKDGKTVFGHAEPIDGNID